MFLLIIAILSYISYRVYQYLNPAPNIDPNRKYVLISGCDSGFGNLLAIELDKQGFNVLAGVLNPTLGEALKVKLSNKATVFSLDITKESDIDAAFDLVTSKTSVLHGLVNNAGIAISGNIDWMPMSALHKVMDVNFFGHVVMTKKFLPLLIAKKDSRVVNICSAAGFLASPAMSAYCASKFALESFSDCLRREMAPWNLRVSIIEPGFMRTPIIESRPKSFDDVWSKFDKDVQERWGDAFIKDLVEKSSNSPLIKLAEDPMKVVRDLQHAVSNTKPSIRYRPGWQSTYLYFPLSMLPAWFTDWFFEKLTKRTVLPAGVAKQNN